MRRLGGAVGIALMLVLEAALPCPAMAADAPPIRLRSRTIQPGATPDLQLGLRVLASARDASSRYMIMQFDELPDANRRAELRARGIELQGYLPERAFVARVSPGQSAAELASLSVRYLGALETFDKVSPALRAGRLPAHARSGAGRVVLYVELHRDVPLAEGLDELRRDFSVRILSRLRSLGGALIEVDEASWPEVAALEMVKWVEPASPQFSSLNNGVRQALAVETVQAAPYDLQGAGVNILLYDGGLVCPAHSAFAGRISVGESGPISSHATHVAGTLAGAATAGGELHRGMAPAANIITYYYPSCDPLCLYNNPQDIEDNYADGLSSYGADFASNSIGSNISVNGYDCELEGDYENTARLIDAISRGSLGRPFASFWAAGNERQGGARCGATYSTIGIPASAKNNIVVGGTYSDTDSIASFSSFGPVDDGRMRPDVVAPGCELGGDGGVTSTRNCTDYTVMCGTSMATPAVAGVAALMLERLREQWPLRDDPMPAIYKAVLAASAVDLGNPGPDYRNGYGLVNAPQAIALIDSGLVEEDDVEHGEVFERTITVPPGLTVLRAALAWDDPPGEPLSSVNLINDLDLRLIAPDQQEHASYVLDPAQPALPATRGANRRDPSELVDVASPAAGTWTVQVAGHSVPDGPQSFALVVNVSPSGSSTSLPPAREITAPPPVPLAQNVPNPFNPTTTIGYRVSGDGGHVKLKIYDASGRLVRVLVDEEQVAGSHQVRWHGCDDRGRVVSGGVYFYELEQDGRRWVRRLVLAR